MEWWCMHKINQFLWKADVALWCLICFLAYQTVENMDLSVMPASGEDVQQAEVKEFIEEKKKIALTFDDGPNPDYTEALLEVLRKNEIKATFFLLGAEVEKYPNIVEDIQKEGHLIGCHSYEHVDLNQLSKDAACEQVQKTNQLIYDITGEYPEYLRPPFGSWKQDLDQDEQMIEVLWDIDTVDWCCQNTGIIVKNVVTQVEENDIILMHDAYATTITAVEELIGTLKNQGYEFVTVDELILE